MNISESNRKTGFLLENPVFCLVRFCNWLPLNAGEGVKCDMVGEDFPEEIPPALRATSLFKGGYLFVLPHELSFFFRDGYSTGISHCHPNNFLHRKIFLRIS